MGITIKRIKNTDYVYFTHYDKGTRSTKYQSCGSASMVESMTNAIKLEREYLKRRREGPPPGSIGHPGKAGRVEPQLNATGWSIKWRQLPAVPKIGSAL